VTEKEMKAKLKEWEKEFHAAALKLQAEAESDEKLREEGAKMRDKALAKRSEFMKEEMTGFVWLYLQK
jgi:hypothetical protein